MVLRKSGAEGSKLESIWTFESSCPSAVWWRWFPRFSAGIVRTTAARGSTHKVVVEECLELTVRDIVPKSVPSVDGLVERVLRGLVRETTGAQDPVDQS